jgi:hypothetical protein
MNARAVASSLPANLAALKKELRELHKQARDPAQRWGHSDGNQGGMTIRGK